MNTIWFAVGVTTKYKAFSYIHSYYITPEINSPIYSNWRAAHKNGAFVWLKMKLILVTASQIKRNVWQAKWFYLLLLLRFFLVIARRAQLLIRLLNVPFLFHHFLNYFGTKPLANWQKIENLLLGKFFLT